MSQVFKQAQQAFETYRNTPIYQRSEILRKISETILLQKEQLIDLVIEESKKPRIYALSEIDRTAHTFLIASEEAKRLPAEYFSLDWAASTQNTEALVRHFPVGVILGFTPFNFPFNLVAHKVAPAISAGCSIVVKPSPRAVKCAEKLQEIALQCGLPKHVFQVIDVPNTEASKLLQEPDVKMLSFTGSPTVGWMLKRESGKKKVALELGGNAAAIVTPTANYKEALKKCLIGGFAYSGQVCIHTQRIFVHESIYDKFLKDYASGASEFKYGNPQDYTTEISDLIDEYAATRVEEWIIEAVKQGAKLITGGKRSGCFVEPTVLTNTSADMKVSCEEVFGPVVIVEPYSFIEEAIERVNKSPYGLQAGIFTDSQSEINKAYNLLDVGGLIVNDSPTFRADHMPYGGVKDSGLGREGVKYAILEMMEPKVLVKPKD
ncbi:MAG: aldehyde dehydrogenase family protein [Flavobacteriales bacterium]